MQGEAHRHTIPKTRTAHGRQNRPTHSLCRDTAHTRETRQHHHELSPQMACAAGIQRAQQAQGACSLRLTLALPSSSRANSAAVRSRYTVRLHPTQGGVSPSRIRRRQQLPRRRRPATPHTDLTVFRAAATLRGRRLCQRLSGLSSVCRICRTAHRCSCKHCC